MIAPREDAEVKKAIDSEMFTPVGKSIGYGCWGQVDLYKDGGENRWAIKYFNPNETAQKQMKERGWTEDHVMINESVPIQAAQHNVAPRIVARDKRGKLFVAMPYYSDGDLSKKINHLDFDQALNITRDIAESLSYTHKNKINPNRKTLWGEPLKGCAHGDVKPSNILLDMGRAYLSDFGSSTCISIDGNGSERGPHGDINYRAPECDNPHAEPSTRADIWGLGAILYESITKEGIREGLDEINQKNINKKLKKIESRKVRKFLKKCLAYDPNKRFYNGESALTSIESAIENLSGWKSFWKHVKKWTLPLAIPISVISLAAQSMYNYEPKRLDMPKTHRIKGVLYPPEHEDKSSLEFIAENITDLPDAPILMGICVPGISRRSKLSTDNRVVAYLVKTHMQAALKKGYQPFRAQSEEQFSTYHAYTNSDQRKADRSFHPTFAYPAVAKSIEVALSHARVEGNKVDLEDVLAISRLGIKKVEQAKRVSGSFDWRKYREAKDSKGNFIIPQNERSFVNQWLSYFHTDVD